ncbi:MAG: hypothetical protein IPN19_03465 [Elusimicrobia bacterium]|nr:hypothetical protein [Elusimicrobiota bacterium]
MKWASAISAESRLESAVKDAAVTIKQQLEGQTPDWVAMFVSRKFSDRYEEAGALLADRLPARVVMGASASGLIGDGHELESQPGISLTAAVLPGVKIHPFALPDEDMPDLDASPGRGKMDRRIGRPKPQFLFLADPFRFGRKISSWAWITLSPITQDRRTWRRAHPNPENALFIDQFCFRNGLVGVAFTGDIELNPCGRSRVPAHRRDSSHHFVFR